MDDYIKKLASNRIIKKFRRKFIMATALGSLFIMLALSMIIFIVFFYTTRSRINNTLSFIVEHGGMLDDDDVPGGSNDETPSDTDDGSLSDTDNETTSDADDNALSGTDDNALSGSDGGTLTDTDDNALSGSDDGTLSGTDDGTPSGTDSDAQNSADGNARDNSDSVQETHYSFGNDFSPEFRFATRFFTVFLDDNGNVIDVYLKHIAAISEDDAQEYATRQWYII